MLPSLPIELEPRVIPAALPQPAPLNDFGGVLSPSQVRTFRDCGAKWYYKYALALPDPPNGSLVRGRVVHQLAEAYFRAKLDGGSPDPDDLQACFEDAWDREAAGAAFGSVCKSASCAFSFTGGVPRFPSTPSLWKRVCIADHSCP